MTAADHLTQIVAIDGPAGAGKSTVARRVAEALGFAYLDTGAMYRAATWWALDREIDLDDPDAVAVSTEQMPLDMREVNGCLEVRVDGRDVTAAIRTPEVTREIHRLDQNPRVRAHLVEQQRRFEAQGPAVAEGRDIGTVVFPKALCKVFLTASLDERTRRRAEQLKASGIPVAFQQLMSEIAERDRSNSERKESPLRQAEDAIVVDTTALTPEETVQHIVDRARVVL
jgi:cytidylate kinase